MSQKSRHSGKPRSSPPRSPTLFFAIFLLLIALAIIVGLLWLLNNPRLSGY
jgi:heme/copper-type cytochrome/quinol oxidase subunit 4